MVLPLACANNSDTPEVVNMSLVSWLATTNQPVGIKSPSSSDLESDLQAGEEVQQPAQTNSQADPACLIPESAHHPSAQTTVRLKIWGALAPKALPVSTPLIYDAFRHAGLLRISDAELS